MKLPLDQGIARSVTAMLNDAGHEAIHVGDIGMATAKDADILARALVESRIALTHDADFHARLAQSGATAPSAVRIRIEGLLPAQMFMLLNATLKQCAADLEAGAAVSILPHGVRVRRLPLIVR